VIAVSVIAVSVIAVSVIAVSVIAVPVVAVPVVVAPVVVAPVVAVPVVTVPVTPVPVIVSPVAVDDPEVEAPELGVDVSWVVVRCGSSQTRAVTIMAFVGTAVPETQVGRLSAEDSVASTCLAAIARRVAVDCSVPGMHHACWKKEALPHRRRTALAGTTTLFPRFAGWKGAYCQVSIPCHG